MADKTTLRAAMETTAWMAVYAAEPDRAIEVKMTYADLFAIYKLIQAGLQGGGVKYASE